MNFSIVQLQRGIHVSSRLNESITIESPGFAESITEGDIRFEKKVGDAVKADELIAKIETDKTAIEIFAPKDGVIEELLVADGASIKAHVPVLKMKVGGAPAAAPAAPVEKKTEPVAQPPSPPKPVAEVAPQPAPTTLPPVPPLPKAPLTTTPVAKVPVTPFQPPVATAPADVTKISGTRTETRVIIDKIQIFIIK